MYDTLGQVRRNRRNLGCQLVLPAASRFKNSKKCKNVNGKTKESMKGPKNNKKEGCKNTLNLFQLDENGPFITNNVKKTKND